MAVSENPRHRARLRILLAGSALLLIIFLLGAYWLWNQTPARILAKGIDTANRIALELAATLPLEPVVQERTILVFHPPRDRADWLAVEESFLIRHEFEHSFLGSVKRFDVEAVARVGMGFSFSDDWTMHLEPDTGRARVRLPDPVVLFVEVTNLRIRRDEDGWWNRLTAADREEALRKLEEEARANFDRQRLGERARSSFMQVIDRVLQGHGFTAEIEVANSVTPDVPAPLH